MLYPSGYRPYTPTGSGGYSTTPTKIVMAPPPMAVQSPNGHTPASPLAYQAQTHIMPSGAPIPHSHVPPYALSASAGKKPAEFPRNLQFGSMVISVHGELGKGSFGIVYKGTVVIKEIMEKTLYVAVKEIKCKSVKELAQAEYEAKLLQKLSEKQPDSLPVFSRMGVAMSTGRCACPGSYVHQTQATGPDRWTLTIVMDRVRGVPIDEFTKTAACKRGYDEALKLSVLLLVQMCPTMQRVSPLCVHRDVNAHNIMVDVLPGESKDQQTQFTLIDFGLATDTKAWQDGEWKSKDIAGDCRYWPCSCWKQFMYGFKYLLADGNDAQEYMYNLDAHSLGLTCLQVLVETTKQPWPAHVNAVHAAFSAYWQDATKFHKELYAVFQGHGTWANLKKSFLQQQIVERTRQNLDRLKAALLESSKWEAPVGAAFFQCVRQMISGKKLNWSELQRILLEANCDRGRVFASTGPATPSSSFASTATAPYAASTAPTTAASSTTATSAAVEGPEVVAPVGEPATIVAPVEMPMMRQCSEPDQSAMMTTPPRERRFGHRRQHTTDDGSMSRHVPDHQVPAMYHSYTSQDVRAPRFTRPDGEPSSNESPRRPYQRPPMPSSNSRKSSKKKAPPGIITDEASNILPSPLRGFSPMGEVTHRRVQSVGSMSLHAPGAIEEDSKSETRCTPREQFNGTHPLSGVLRQITEECCVRKMNSLQAMSSGYLRQHTE